MGVANGGKSAVFSVSSDVVGVAGDGLCSPTPESCQLLALDKGKTADLTYAFANKVYTLRVADIRLRVTTKKPKQLRRQRRPRPASKSEAIGAIVSADA